MDTKIQEYKKQFEAVYEKLIADFGVEYASVSISWKSEYVNGKYIKKPTVLITL